MAKNKDKLKIIDDSGDRDFFTIIPNYILNHSTSNDQSLYLQMKRYAGEDGRCFATQETLMNKMGIGRMAYNKSLKYLIKHKWIDFTGLTGGKTRPIKTYKINNIWELNNNHYKKIPSETALSIKKEIPSETTEDTGQNSSKIPARTAIEEEPVLSRTIIKNQPSKALALQGNQWNQLIDPFKEVNPLYEDIYKNTTERKALDYLVGKFGITKVQGMIESLPEIVSQPYAPKITKPSELKRDLAKLILFYKQNSNKQSKYGGLKVY